MFCSGVSTRKGKEGSVADTGQNALNVLEVKTRGDKGLQQRKTNINRNAAIAQDGFHSIMHTIRVSPLSSPTP